MRPPNLFKENVLEEEKESSREQILISAWIALKEYQKYIDKSIKVVQEQGTIKVNVTKIELDPGINAWKVHVDALNEQMAKRADNELFNREIKYVYLEKPIDPKAKKVEITDRNAEEGYLIFKIDSDKDIDEIYLKANDYQLKKQRGAINQLMYSPNKCQDPLLQLFNQSNAAARYFEKNVQEPIGISEIDWKVLKDDTRDGTGQQKSFVCKALRTNDFTLLEGPPGSGKTTAIIELILQLIKKGKRVLLVSATHVAVDNVIHRILTSYKNECEGKVVPLRIGDEGNIRKESVKPYRLQTFVKKKKAEVKKRLGNKKKRTESQQKLYNYLRDGSTKNSDFNDIILKSANLVGGTMIGVLKHPNIGNPSSDEMFDVMIVDESSKVTFLDFIVPALYAKKWILVGDVQQLSPYVEDDYISESIDQLLESKEEKERLVHQFEFRKEIQQAKGEAWGTYLKVIVTKDVKDVSFDDLGIVYRLANDFSPTLENIFALNSADVVICMDSKIAKDYLAQYVFVKTKVFEGYIDAPEFKNRQKFLHQIRSRKTGDKYYHDFEKVKEEKQEWKQLVGSRLGQYYEYRFNPKEEGSIKGDLKLLMPNEACWDAINHIRKIALPSILELLQIGIGETKSKNGYVQNKIIYEGFKKYSRVKHLKFESLKFQHRMNDAIARTSKKHFYNGENLITANTVTDRENPLSNYDSNYGSVVWVANQDNTFRKKGLNGKTKNINPREQEGIRNELINFIEYARSTPKRNHEAYEVAVLTFYRQQESELKQMLRRLTGERKQNKFFSKANVKITLCTVDKFQGDEADLVLLSFAVFKRRAFYNNSNRLNVAITRARYKLVLYGNKSWLGKKAMSEALKALANTFEERISSQSNHNKKKK